MTQPLRSMPSELDAQRSAFMKRLRLAGWKRPISGNPIYTHRDGGWICIDTYTDGKTAWKHLFDADMMPETNGRYG